MKAVIITKPGGADVLEIREVQTPPDPVANRVRVRVRASALNRADILQRMGRYPAPPGAPKDIPGLEFAGEVDQVGPEVRTWKPGQRVFGITGSGAHAEYVIVPGDHLVEIPENLSWENAAAVPEVFITAHDALFTQARLTIGETLLVHAAGSGVGTAASQLAKAAGARVIGTSRTPDKLEQARGFGFDETIAVGNDPLTIVNAIRELTGGHGVDVVLDLVGGAYLEANIRSLANKGRLFFVGTTSGAQGNLDIGTVMGKRLKLRGTVLRARSEEEKATATRLFARHVGPLLANGTVRPVVDKVYKLEDVARAHERIESNQNFGKVVLLVD
ncbi:MAG: NAD(P)H-quinone oxidoreductase [Blastocatellia bacterium]|nr:MAG: NAD(P)H-quinone oxidoreductase [Blastocatellia bacterium]